MKAPQDCDSMAELRQQIDALDVELVKLMARRVGYIDRAIELKPGESLPARIEARVAAVLEKVRQAAVREGFDPALAEELWRVMIEWSITREERVLGRSSG